MKHYFDDAALRAWSTADAYLPNIVHLFYEPSPGEPDMKEEYGRRVLNIGGSFQGALLCIATFTDQPPRSLQTVSNPLHRRGPSSISHLPSHPPLSTLHLVSDENCSPRLISPLVRPLQRGGEARLSALSDLSASGFSSVHHLPFFSTFGTVKTQLAS